MTWEDQEIEKRLNDILKLKYTPTKAQEFYTDYVSARNKLIRNIYNEIKASEPTLSHHDASHIVDVLDKAHKLLEDECEITPIELYSLCVSILFHDVGNLEGRKNHQKKISEIYDFVRDKESRFNDERLMVRNVAGAHCGRAQDGTNDTLKFVANLPVRGELVRAQKVAAVLRLADELAEGPQRTSEYAIDKCKYPDESMIYHRYAQITNICIDKGSSRILLNYDIKLSKEDDEIRFDKKIDLEDMLEFIYMRILKLDQERRYTKHYCDWLGKFKETSVTINFWFDHDLVNLGLEPLLLSDLIIPGDDKRSIPVFDQNYDISELLKNLRSNIS